MEWGDVEKKLDEIWNEKVTADDIEDQFLDVKQYPNNWNALIDLCRKMVVCFSNADGGTIVIGVREKIKGITAFEGCKKFRETDIVQKINGGLNSPVDIEVNYRNFHSTPLLEIKVPQGICGAHSLSNSQQWKRSGAECLPLLPTLESTPKFITVSELDRSSSIVPDMNWEDMDKKELQKIKGIIKNLGLSLDYLNLDDLDFAKAIGLIKEERGKEVVTMAGLLFSGEDSIRKEKSPQSEIIFVSHDEGGDSDFQINFNQSLITNITNLQDLFEKKYNPSVLLDTGLFEIPLKRLPLGVLRESLLNAITHREYANTSSIFFNVYPDKIEITNPGGFVGGITPENILTHQPAWRNRLIAEVFQKIGLVRRSGLGVDRAYRELLLNGKEPPIYISDNSQVKMVILDKIDKELAKYIRNEEKSGEGVPLDEMIVISHLRSSPQITISETSKAIQRSHADASAVLTRMTRKGVLEPKGVTKGRYYSLTPKIYNVLGDSVGYARNGSIEYSRFKEKIRILVEEKKHIVNSQVRDLLGISPNKAKNILKEMVDSNELTMKGKKRGAVYLLPIVEVEKNQNYIKKRTKNEPNDQKNNQKIDDFNE